MIVRSYQDLIAWQKSMDLVEKVYAVTWQFPKEELYCLTTQLRRAVISIPSNIAEGQGRNSSKEFVHHLSIAYGSLMETETQLLIGTRLNYATIENIKEVFEQSAEVGRLINGLSNSIERKYKSIGQ